MNKVRSLEEILHRCAVLRCVATLQHRTGFRLDCDDKVLVKWAELFEDYCEREYGNDAKI